MGLAERSRTPIPLRRRLRVYICGPMRGMPELNFPAFNEAAERLRNLGHDVCNPADNGDDKPFRENMAWDLDWIARYADAIAVLPGWENSRGATVEVALARAIEIPVAPVEAFWPSGPDPRALL